MRDSNTLGRTKAWR